MQFLTKQHIEDLEKIETPIKILEETIKKHFPDYKMSYYLRALYQDVIDHIINPNHAEEC